MRKQALNQGVDFPSLDESSRRKVVAQVGAELIESIEALGAHVYVPRTDRDYALNVGLRLLTLRHMVQEEDGLYRANESELHALRYYANSIAHLCKQLDLPTKSELR